MLVVGYTKFMKNIPRIIWIMWYQGREEMPALVEACYQSWLVHHPNWEVRLITWENVDSWVDIPSSLGPERVSMQSYSDLVRLRLLHQYGGVWVDASLWCQQPLDQWLGSYTREGFFMFQARPFVWSTIWFLASAPNHFIIRTWTEAVGSYWHQHWVQLVFFQKVFQKIELRCFDLTGVWLYRHLYRFTLRYLGLYPYFLTHYLLLDLLEDHQEFKGHWEAMPLYDSNIPHTVIFHGMHRPLSPEIKQHIDQKVSPVYKLSWKGRQKLVPGSILAYLLDSGSNRA